jgi:glutaredoxin
MPLVRTNPNTTLFTALVTLLLASPVGAQYKWVGPDGQLNYGDRPPSQEAQKMRAGVGPGRVLSTEGSAASDLPYATRTAASRAPVVLYAAADCNLCDQARRLLVERGIPFSEKQIRAKADLEAYKQAGFSDGSVPGLSVGAQRTQGYEATAWQGLLDSAGYPKSARLPEGYRAPQAVSLASGKPALDGPAAAQAAAQEKLAQEKAAQEKIAQARSQQEKLQSERTRAAAMAANSEPGRFKF